MLTSTLIKTLASHSHLPQKSSHPLFSWLSHPLSGPTKNEKAPLKTFLRSSSSYEISSHEVLPPLCRVPAPPTQCCVPIYIFFICSNLHFVFFVSLFRVFPTYFFVLFFKIGMHWEVFQDSYFSISGLRRFCKTNFNMFAVL